MKIVLPLADHSQLVAQFAQMYNMPFCGDIHSSSKDEFFGVFWVFRNMKITAEPESLFKEYDLSFKSHNKKIMAAISAYEQGTGSFSECWQCLGWAIAWYFQSKILNQ